MNNNNKRPVGRPRKLVDRTPDEQVIYERNCAQKRKYNLQRYHDRGGDLDAWIDDRLTAIRRRAKTKGLECTITRRDITTLVCLNCPITGVQLSYDRSRGNQKNAASVDRIDNTKGYVPGNIVICAASMNTAKGMLTVGEIRQLADFLNRHEEKKQELCSISVCAAKLVTLIEQLTTSAKRFRIEGRNHGL